MDFYILARSLIYLFLSVNHPTTLIFDEPVEYVSAGREGDFSLHRSNNQKILVIRPLKDNFETDMIVITKDHHYQFKINAPKQSEKTHSLVYIHNGALDRSYVLKYESEKIRILEGETSTLIQNKTKKGISVNDIEITKDGNFSKGIPFIVDGERVLN